MRRAVGDDFQVGRDHHITGHLPPHKKEIVVPAPHVLPAAGHAVLLADHVVNHAPFVRGCADVGAPSHKGSVVYDVVRKEYRVTGGGENMWGGHDDFFFVWRKVTGDVVITANLKIVTDGAPHRKAGLIIRKALETGSVYADAVVHGAGLTSLQWREKPDDVTRTITFPVDGPTRLRPERRRNVAPLY